MPASFDFTALCMLVELALALNFIVYSAASYEPVMRCRLSRNLAGMLLTDAQQKAAAAAAAALLAAAIAAADRAAGE